MQRISDLERRYVSEVLDSQFRSSAGCSMTQRLEQKFSEAFQSRFAIAFVNGTATLHAALAAAGVGPGDEVIVPPLTMASTSFAVLHSGAIPVFADISPDTWTLDPACIDNLITPSTKAIIPVAIYGLAPDLERILEIAQRRSLFVLEDDAQCFLGYYKGRVVGSIGDAASFSFQSSKHLTSGEGGMIVTQDGDLAERIRRFNSLGYAGVGASKAKITRTDIQDPCYERHLSSGFNYRMPELCAAVALGQVERIEELVEVRRRTSRLLAAASQKCSWLTPQFVPEGLEHSYWTYVLKLDGSVDFTWYDFRDEFIERGGDPPYAAWQLTYLEPALRGVALAAHQRQNFSNGLCPVAESLQPRLLQFCTNCFKSGQAERQAEALAGTIAHFEGRHATAAPHSVGTPVLTD